MVETRKIKTVILTLSFDRSTLDINAGETWDQANDPQSFLLFSNREPHKTALVVEILKKLTAALENASEGIDLTIDGRIIRAGSSATVIEKPIDLNRASPEELPTLPGIGPSLATAIIQGRSYQSVEDLLKAQDGFQSGGCFVAEIVRVGPTSVGPTHPDEAVREHHNGIHHES